MDCRTCVYVTKVIPRQRYWCRKLGMIVFPQNNGSETCCWYKTKEDYDRENDPAAYPHGVHPGDHYP